MDRLATSTAPRPQERTGRTYPDGTVYPSVYDDDGRLVQLSQPPATTAYAYDAASRPVRVDLPNGTRETRSYDAAGRLQEVHHGHDFGPGVSGHAYTRDSVGNPLTESTLTGTTTHRYDALDRLVEACYQADCTVPGADRLVYTYDRGRQPPQRDHP